VFRWTYAFVDRADLAAAGAFWTEVTATRLSPPRGDAEEFVTLLPAHGDAYLKAQAVHDGAGAHLDLCADDVDAVLRRARGLGATDLAVHDGWATLRSPTGLPFCVVPWHGETDRPEPVRSPAGALSRVDQVCVDVAPSGFHPEVAFWTALTGWASTPGSRPEFHLVKPPPGLPIRILLQRLGEERPTGAHLDLACADPAAVADWHESLGATIVLDLDSWIVMRDPAGGSYCLTGRDPVTGDGRG
jgi:hypothetical protein